MAYAKGDIVPQLEAIRRVHGQIYKIEVHQDMMRGGYRVHLILDLHATDELSIYQQIAPVLIATDDMK